MAFWGLKKGLKQCDSVIEIVSEDEEENNELDVCDKEKIDGKNLLEEVDEKTIEMSRTLMIYIGGAIDKWAQEYDMGKLPRNIVFKKALGLMNLWEKVDDFK